MVIMGVFSDAQQFVWFSFINYRAMNCIDNNTDVYMVLKKTASLPKYDESVTERGYDNTEFVEKIRYSSRSNWKNEDQT